MFIRIHFSTQEHSSKDTNTTTDIYHPWVLKPRGP